MNRKGVTLVELVIVFFIMSLVVGTFHGLIEQVTQTTQFVLGRKAAYQQAKFALEEIIDDVQYRLRGGEIHNFGINGVGQWQVHGSPCTDRRFTFFPNFSDTTDSSAYYALESSPGDGLPSGFYLVRAKFPGAVPTTLAKADSVITFRVRYYDQAGNQMTIAPSGLVQDQAKVVTHVAFVVTLTLYGESITFSEVVFVGQKGLPPQETGVI